MPDINSTMSTSPTFSLSEAAPASPVPAGIVRLRRAARGALVLAALALPFELLTPLARVGPLQLTSVELVLYVALALSGAAVAADALTGWKQLPWRRIAARHAGVLLFVIVLLLSAARAPLARTDAMKFAFRNMGGIALYVAAANLLRAPAAALTVSVAMSIGAVVASVLMWAELHIPGAAAALSPFHARTFDVFGLPRASGPFQYPNIAAMYLEAALPVTLMAGAAVDARRGRRSRAGAGMIASTIAALAIVEALSLTASRAAMLAAGVMLALLAAYGLRRRIPGRWQAPAVLAMVGLLAFANTAAGSLNGLRLKFWKDGVWYRSAIVPAAGVPATLAPAEHVHFDVDVRNAGARSWPAAGPKPIALSYHWIEEGSGKLVVYDGVRTRLPQDVPAGGTIRLLATVRAPAQAGRYRLHLEMVHELTTWFGEQGDGGYDAIVDVRYGARAADARRGTVAAAVVPPASDAPLEGTTRATLWRAAIMAWREHPLLGLGPDNFRRAYSRYLPPGSSARSVRPDERLHANNLFLEILANLGLAGIAALVLIVVGFAGAARVAVRHHGAASVAGLVAAGAATGLGAYLVHGLFDYFLEFTPTYALFWLLGGLLTGLAADPERAAT
jgi:O-antigen ligase